MSWFLRLGLFTTLISAYLLGFGSKEMICAGQKVELVFEKEYGGTDEERPNYTFFRPRDVALDKEGNLFVLDSGNARIMKYNMDGVFQNSYGRRGQGPGEFRVPTSLQLRDSDGGMIIDQDGTGITHFLDKNGKELRRIKQYGMGISNPWELNSKKLLAINFRAFQENQRGDRSGLLVVVNSSASKRFLDFVAPSPDNDRQKFFRKNDIVYQVDKEENVYVAFRHQNIIEKYTSRGKKLLTFKRDTNVRVSDPKVKKPVRRSGTSGSGAVVGLVPVPEMNVFTRGIGADTHSHIWVFAILKQKQKSNNPREPIPEKAALEIYDHKGMLIDQIRLPEQILPRSYPGTYDNVKFRIFGDKIYFVENTNRMSVLQYKIIEH